MIKFQIWHVITFMYVCRFQNLVLRCPTPRLHCFPSSHWPSFTFLPFMAYLIPSSQFFFGLPRALFCFGIHCNAIMGNLPFAILWTWPYHVSRFCSISFIIGSSNLTLNNVALVCQNNYSLACACASRWMRGAIILRKHLEILVAANWNALLDTPQTQHS